MRITLIINYYCRAQKSAVNYAKYASWTAAIDNIVIMSVFGVDAIFRTVIIARCCRNKNTFFYACMCRACVSSRFGVTFLRRQGLRCHRAQRRVYMICIIKYYIYIYNSAIGAPWIRISLKNSSERETRRVYIIYNRHDEGG